jgi:uncharacterized cupredoxin-like copper-binding protein
MTADPDWPTLDANRKEAAMSPELQQEDSSKSLEAELHDLQRDERALKDRIEKSQIAMLVAVVFAVVASTAALALALEKSTNTNTIMMRGAGSTSAQRSNGTMGPGMMNGAATRGGVAASRTVKVDLGEMYARPDASSISAGKVTFVAHNSGRMIHELMVERSPIKLDGPGRPNEDAAIGMIEDMTPGTTGRMTLKLKPGTYELFCNVTGHYAAGQHTTFRVTKS